VKNLTILKVKFTCAERKLNKKGVLHGTPFCH